MVGGSWCSGGWSKCGQDSLLLVWFKSGGLTSVVADGARAVLRQWGRCTALGVV